LADAPHGVSDEQVDDPVPSNAACSWTMPGILEVTPGHFAHGRMLRRLARGT
jgi:hypothetical protein